MLPNQTTDKWHQYINKVASDGGQLISDSTTECVVMSNSELSCWRHQMETFSALLARCAGDSPVTGEFPAQRPVTRSFDVFFDLHLNKRLSKQSWGWWFETPSRHYDVTVMRSTSAIWAQSSLFTSPIISRNNFALHGSFLFTTCTQIKKTFIFSNKVNINHQ